jgi:UTP--glucose-1-phosphate uridylyltransferase
MCERINEEREDINLEISDQLDPDPLSPTTRLADFDYLSIYKRHHRPRPVIPRSSSSPNLIDVLLSDHPFSLNQLHPLPPLPPLPQKLSKPTAKKKMASLNPPRSDYIARTRGASHIDFRTATTGVIGKAMRNELSQLVNSVQDPQTRKASRIPPVLILPIIDLDPRHSIQKCSPFSIFSPVILQSVPRLKNCQFKLVNFTLVLTLFHRNWDRIKSPGDDQIVPYSSLPKPKDTSALNKLAVLKVNGGLGTSMGMDLSRLLENFFLRAVCLHRYDRRQERA